jgi:hypothetical protein
MEKNSLMICEICNIFLSIDTQDDRENEKHEKRKKFQSQVKVQQKISRFQ